MRPLAATLVACALLVLAAGGASAADTPRWVGMPEKRAPEPRDRERIARHYVEKARSLRRADELDAALATLARARSVRPGWAPIHLERARVLEALGRSADALSARARADLLAPPPPPLSTDALTPTDDLRVLLLPPAEDARAERRPANWPEGDVASTIERRLRTLLPNASVTFTRFERVAPARAWLERHAAGHQVISLRVERIYCGDDVKHGRFGLAQLRVATSRGGRSALATPVRVVLDEPRLAVGCRHESIARALDAALEIALRVSRDAATEKAAWSSSTIRRLFPSIDAFIATHLAEGHARLAAGQLARALASFETAASADADDPVPAAYARDVSLTLEISREVAGRRGRSGDDLPARLSRAQRAALEAQLAMERERQDRLVAALAVLEENARVPDAKALRGLVSVAPRRGAFGLALAEQRSGGTVRVRAALAPDGRELARYYFAPNDPQPLLRADDADGDGEAERWIGYAGSHRAEIWEGRGTAGRPDVRLVLGPDGRRLARAEFDRDGNGMPERVLHYAAGDLQAQALDADADGRFEIVDRFEAGGRVRIREEDVDGDGVYDVRSRFEAGKLVHRELRSAELGS